MRNPYPTGTMMYRGCTIMLSPKGSVWVSSFSMMACSVSMEGAAPLVIRLLWLASNSATPSKIVGLLNRMEYTCLLIVRLAEAAYIPGTWVIKPTSSLINASRVMEN